MTTKIFITAAMLWATVATASSVPADAPMRVSQGAPAAADDDEDETPSATPKSTPATKTDDKKTPATGVGTPSSTTPVPATNTPAATATTPTATTNAPVPTAPAGTKLVLVSGAPLNNPNVGVHIVEQKEHSDSGRREIVLYPISAQVNGKFTQHFGSMASFVYHLQENFGLQITGGYNWFNSESGFNAELVEKVRAEAQAATSLLWTWGVLGGVEVTPIYGKFALFEGTLAHFSIIINGGAGAGGTRHQLKPESVRQDGTVSPATYGDTGARFMASLGAGFRLQLGERFAFRLEVRDVIYTARVERVNGCNVDDLKAMDTALRMGKLPENATVGGGCDVSTFAGTYEGTDIKRSNDVPLALNLVKVPSSDVLNNVGLYLGASFLF